MRHKNAGKTADRRLFWPRMGVTLPGGSHRTVNLVPANGESWETPPGPRAAICRATFSASQRDPYWQVSGSKTGNNRLFMPNIPSLGKQGHNKTRMRHKKPGKMANRGPFWLRMGHALPGGTPSAGDSPTPGSGNTWEGPSLSPPSASSFFRWIPAFLSRRNRI